MIACLAVTTMMFVGCDPEEPVEPPTPPTPIDAVELTSPITANTTLKDLGLPIDYYFNGDVLEVKNNAILTIEDSVTIQFHNANGLLLITDGATLKALGKVNKHIQFVGATTTKGVWRGVEIRTQTENELTYVDILNAGKGSNDWSAALYINQGSVSVNHCLIDRSKNNGVSVQGQWGKGVLTTFSNNTVSNCDKAPIYTHDFTSIWNVRNIDNTNTFTGNANAYIHISDYGNAPLYSNVTLHHLNGYPWYMQKGMYLQDEKDVTIEAGATLLIGAGARIGVNGNEHLIAVGTASSPITIKGLQENTGFWKGIVVSSLSPGTKFDYCTISDAGQEMSGGTAYSGAIRYEDKSYVEIYNTLIRRSLNNAVLCLYSSPSFNTHYNAFLKHANVTFEQIGGSIFFITNPNNASYGALPTMSGDSWWQHF
jgi:hypothetical protein